MVASICWMRAMTPRGLGVAVGPGCGEGTDTDSGERVGPRLEVAAGGVAAQDAYVRHCVVAHADATNDTTMARTSAVRIVLFNATAGRAVR